MKVKVFYYDGVKNVGDMLTVPILKYLGHDAQLVKRNRQGKMLCVGSIMAALRPYDTVWGSGCIRDVEVQAPEGVRFLAVRGPKTRALIKGAKVPEVYGDPALLLPLIYNPKIEPVHEVGIIPHYVDKEVAPLEGKHFIDVQADWPKVVEEIKSCKKIISSSLHGIIIAEAYGVPAVWAKYSDKIIGGDFKFQDYFLGTGRSEQEKNKVIPPITNLEEIQNNLIEAFNGR